MSGAVRAAAGVDRRGFVDTERESDFPVLAAVSFIRAPRGGRFVTMSAVRQVLSGSSGSVVDAGVC